MSIGEYEKNAKVLKAFYDNTVCHRKDGFIITVHIDKIRSIEKGRSL